MGKLGGRIHVCCLTRLTDCKGCGKWEFLLCVEVMGKWLGILPWDKNHFQYDYILFPHKPKQNKATCIKKCYPRLQGGSRFVDHKNNSVWVYRRNCAFNPEVAGFIPRRDIAIVALSEVIKVLLTQDKLLINVSVTEWHDSIWFLPHTESSSHTLTTHFHSLEFLAFPFAVFTLFSQLEARHTHAHTRSRTHKACFSTEYIEFILIVSMYITNTAIKLCFICCG